MPKAESLCSNGFSSLKNYLVDVRDNCPDEYFQKGPRGSGLKFNLDLDIRHVKGHEVSELARLGLADPKFKTAHSNVQMFMLQNDNNTISIEVPIWLLDKELPSYMQLFDSTDPLTGHIDALRIEDDKVWIWDYKPNARKEKFASTQTNFYALMLSKRTGVPLEKFRCGYFDDEDAYVFRPVAIKYKIPQHV
ncbi:MAG: PD-(D/E)XK nuclease family protein [Candidatus Woesearchaeota archaeon]